MASENSGMEYKQQLTGFEKETVAFLNYREGGVIGVEINKTGKIVGARDRENGEYNYVDYLLADLNSVSVKVAKYACKLSCKSRN